MDSELKAKRREAKAELAKAQVDAVREIACAALRNPALNLVGGLALIEYLQKEKIVGEIAGTAAEVALGSVCISQALAPLVPEFTEAFSTVLKTLLPLIP